MDSSKSPGLRGAAVLLALSLAGSAWAQGGGNQPRLVLQALDTDGDGQLSAAELQAAPHALLTLDRNADGALTEDELHTRPENAGASADELTRLLMQFDKNGDGVLTPDELPTRMQTLFQRGDINHDGRLTPEEIRSLAAHQNMPAGAPSDRAANAMRMDPLLFALDTDHNGVISGSEIAAARVSLLTLDKNGDGVIEAEEMRPRQTTPEERVNHLLGEWDTNGDGRLSNAEAPDRMQQQFEAIDKNGDGYLDRTELLLYFTAQTGSGNAARPHSAGADGADNKEKNQ